LAEFSEVEIEFLRAQAEANGVEADDASLLDTLRFRAACRVWMLALQRSDSGEDPINQEVRNLAEVTANEHGQPEIAATYRQLVVSLEQGDITSVGDWVAGSCAGVTIDPDEKVKVG